MNKFPSNWSEMKISQFAKRVKRKNSNQICDNVLTISANDGLIAQKEYFKKIVASKDTSGYTLLENGEFAYNKSYSEGFPVGAARRLRRYPDGIVSPLYICFCINQEILDLRYADYLFDSQWFISAIYSNAKEGARSHGLLNLGINEFFEASLPLPPLLEQKKIASMLTSVDKAIANIEKQINKLQNLKKATMNELISKGIGKTDISDNEFGKIPKNSDMNDCSTNWSFETLSDISHRIIDGTHFSPKSKNGTNIYLTAKNIKDGKINLDEISLISDEEHEVIYSRCDVKKGDILFTKDGTVGEVAINTLEDELSLLSSVAVLKINNKYCLTQYVYQWLRSSIFQDIIKKRLTGTALSRLTLEKINKLPILFPPLSEQQKITSILTTMDKLIETTKKQINQTKSLKKSLMQDLLSGSKRVNI